jgi:hypothetical protein
MGCPRGVPCPRARWNVGTARSPGEQTIALILERFFGLMLRLSDSAFMSPGNMIAWVGSEEKEKDDFKWRSTRN